MCEKMVSDREALRVALALVDKLYSASDVQAELDVLAPKFGTIREWLRHKHGELVDIHDLKSGDLFTWDAQPDYLHRFVRVACRESDGALEACEAECVMGLMDGVWHHQAPARQNWNPYCQVRRARISVQR